jgi:hypothetical protein
MLLFIGTITVEKEGDITIQLHHTSPSQGF